MQKDINGFDPFGKCGKIGNSFLVLKSTPRFTFTY